MADASRAHERLSERALPGVVRAITGPDGRPMDLFVPRKPRDPVSLVVHFNGAAWLPMQAVTKADDRAVAVIVNRGAGSSVYQRPFADPAAFDSLLTTVERELSAMNGRPARVGRVTLVGFSAGYGAIRAILRELRHVARVDGVLLLDGLHTSYVPEGSGLAAGGVLDTMNLAPFAAYARLAAQGGKRFLVTHSEIFPGTYASTTETADWLLSALGMKRKAVLRWGPRGMQQLSESRSGQFEVMGFAGNSAPDHIDQLHAMPELLARLLKR